MNSIARICWWLAGLTLGSGFWGCKIKPPQVVAAVPSSAPPVSEAFFPDSMPPDSPLLTDLLRKLPDSLLPIIQQPGPYRLQVIYTQIDRDSNNRPQFRHYYFHVTDQYTYPASTVKLPAAVLALEKLNKLGIDGLGMNTPMFTGPLRVGEKPVFEDATSKTGKPSVAHYIKKILLVSDNDAHNRLYEFLGQEGFNARLHQLGMSRAQMTHRLSMALSDSENRATNPVWFTDAAGKMLYRQPFAFSKMIYASRYDTIGRGYLKYGPPGQGTTLVAQPLDFSTKNRWPLQYAHLLTQWILFPESQPDSNRLLLSPSDYRFLWKYMSMLPQESQWPSYTEKDAWPTYVKFLMTGSEPGNWPLPGIRIFNKVGDAYGHLLDAAYIVDFEKQVEFLLSAVIYCNSDGILNDDKYEYDEVGFPFMKALGKVVYEYEINRQRPRSPDLSRFIVDYSD